MITFKKNQAVLLLAASLLFLGCNRFSTKDFQTPENINTGSPDQPSTPVENCATATLTWNKVIVPTLAGYKIYSGL